ncbi:MAG: flagellar biosynthetic protein FliO [Candidatus Gastranaerophilales bacterium]|nr:flagellar biosynthetic protein FliO [Candidatus Gastranaerophilales bacterium]
MAHYLMKFIFYTSGVIGLLFIAFLVAKSSLNINTTFAKKNKNLEIEESLNLSPRKTLHVVRAFNEKFLVASDANSTTLLAKLNSDGEIIENINNMESKVNEDFQGYLEEKQTPKRQRKTTAEDSIIKSMLNKLNN